MSAGALCHRNAGEALLSLLFFFIEASTIQPLLNETTTEGEKFNLFCNSSGTPPPVVSWVRISTGQRFDGHVLALTNINRGKLETTDVKLVMTVGMTQRLRQFMLSVSTVSCSAVTVVCTSIRDTYSSTVYAQQTVCYRPDLILVQCMSINITTAYHYST